MKTCMKVGAYLLLKKGLDLSAVLRAFRPFHAELEGTSTDSIRGQHDVTVASCWGALDQALRLGWLVGPSSRAEPRFDAEEFAHYAHPANGRVHILAPGSLLLFPAPAELEGGREWADPAPAAARDGPAPPPRRFSAGFSADLLADLGASAVLFLDAAPPAAARAFAARVMAVWGARGAASPLAAMDWLLMAG